MWKPQRSMPFCKGKMLVLSFSSRPSLANSSLARRREMCIRDSAQSALARLNEQLTTLKMTLEANSADKAVVDKAPVEAMDAAGSV